MSAKTRNIVLSAALASALAMPAARAATYAVFSSGDAQFTTLPGDNVRRVLYRVPIDDAAGLAVGDILVITSEAQIQNPAVTTQIDLAAQLMRADSSDLQTGIGPANTFNINPSDYRGVPVKVAVAKITGQTDKNIIELVVWAKPSGSLSVVTGGGRLQVLRIRP